MREEREGSREPRGNAGRTSGETDGGGGVPVARVRGGARSRAAEPAERPERRAGESAREGEVRGVALFWGEPGPSPGLLGGDDPPPKGRQERLRRIASLRRGVHRAACRRAHRGRGM